jgi:hypothetical protein
MRRNQTSSISLLLRLLILAGAAVLFLRFLWARCPYTAPDASQ